MKELLVLESEKVRYSDMLELVQVGYQECEPEHAYGPAIRDYFLIHYIVKGQGIVDYEDQKIKLGEGEMFLIEPGEVTTYQADVKNPWFYYWFAYKDTEAKAYTELLGMDRSRRTRRLGQIGASIEKELKELIKIRLKEESDKIFAIISLYKIFYFLRKDYETSKEYLPVEQTMNRHVRMAVGYIKRHYTLLITIQDIADYVTIDRTQLYKLFMVHLKISPQMYLMKLRMDRALKLLMTTDLPVKSIAYSIGYQDPYVFSKVFKKNYGASPRNYQKLYKK